MSYKKASAADLRGAAELIVGPFKERILEEIDGIKQSISSLASVSASDRETICSLADELRDLRILAGNLQRGIGMANRDAEEKAAKIEESFRLERDARFLASASMVSKQISHQTAVDRKIKSVLIEMAKLENEL